MAQSQLSLAWDQYKRNICNGLSSLQQNGEFVDMTLAADGHFVKVHQVIIALASPFIKELISSVQCSHPVIFLNKISYNTLCSILEYIYTGEVLVSIENLDELVQAGQELHIKGLEDMKLQQSMPRMESLYQSTQSVTEDLEEVRYFEVTSQKEEDDQTELDFENTTLAGETASKELGDVYEVEEMIEEDMDEDYAIMPMKQDIVAQNIELKNIDTSNVRVMQYTVSNQGSLQMILNRFVYYLKHTNRNNSRQWRCVDYVSNVKCPAHVITKDDIVVQRISAHTHPFHDKKILKKVKAGAIFSAILEAENEGRKQKKTNKNNTESE